MMTSFLVVVDQIVDIDQAHNSDDRDTERSLVTTFNAKDNQGNLQRADSKDAENSNLIRPCHA